MNIHFVHEWVCKLYLELLERNRVKICILYLELKINDVMFDCTEFPFTAIIYLSTNWVNFGLWILALIPMIVGLVVYGIYRHKSPRSATYVRNFGGLLTAALIGLLAFGWLYSVLEPILGVC